MSVLTEQRDGALVITLNRPEAGNSLNGAVGQALCDALAAAVADPDVRTIVVMGAGEKIFCAGMDLKAFAAGEDIAPVGRAFVALRECPKPIIAAVNGAALAGGFEVMMGADLVVAAEHARFGIPEVKRGLVAAGGGTRLPTRIPLQVALEMGLTGEPISAARALELGLINRVVPADQVLDTALGLAALINANGPLAVQATKLLMREEVGPDTAKRVGEATAHVFASEDAREGAIAFAQKRSPEWKGR
ncbi:MAG: enoyl-CoA hydratase-related protein [Actinomycetota bacterium]|jgi:enoyl-CoA hydratase/crotonobetainyl-CoA hydratase